MHRSLPLSVVLLLRPLALGNILNQGEESMNRPVVAEVGDVAGQYVAHAGRTVRHLSLERYFVTSEDRFNVFDNAVVGGFAQHIPNVSSVDLRAVLPRPFL